MSRSDDDVLGFIAASFPSVWTLELLIVLRHELRAWTRPELVTELHASELVVAKALDALVAAGLASLETDGAAYLPVSSEVDACAARAEQLYRSRPNAVRRTIIAANTSSAAAFADAFRIRKGSDD